MTAYAVELTDITDAEFVVPVLATDDRDTAMELCVTLQPYLRYGFELHFTECPDASPVLTVRD